MAQNIIKIHNTYFAVLDVPRALRPTLGRSRFKKSLETSNLNEAIKRAALIVAEWRKQIARTERCRVEEDAAAWFRRAHKAAEESPAVEVLGTAGHMPLDDLRVLKVEAAERMEEEVSPKAAKTFVKLVSQQTTPIRPLFDLWIKHIEGAVEPKTIDMHRQVMALLLARHTNIESLTRTEATKFVAEVLAADRAPATVNRMISTLSGFWDWMITKDHVSLPTNVWSKQRIQVKRRTVKRDQPDGPTLKRRPLTEAEGKALLEGLKRPWDVLICQMMAVTGMRIEEVCSLQVGDLELGDDVVWVDIKEGKTTAAARRLPIVEPVVIQGLAARCKDQKGDARVFPELTANKYDDYSAAVSKRLARVLDGITKDPTAVAGHSWRHRGETIQEHAGITPWVSDWFMGHARPGEGKGRYSAGPSVSQMIEAARALTLPQ